MKRAASFLPIGLLTLGMLTLGLFIYADFDAARHEVAFCTHEGDFPC
jgi:hypothetical protein